MMKRLIGVLILLFVLGMGRVAHAQIACADSTTPCKSGESYGFVVSNSTATQLIAFDGNRKSLIIANQPSSTSSVCISLGFTASLSGGVCNGFVLAAGGKGLLLANYSMGNSTGGVTPYLVSAIGLTGNASVTYYFTD